MAMEKMRSCFCSSIIVLVLLAMGALNFASARDPEPVQDFCISVDDINHHSASFVNGMLCKNPEDVTSDDFLYEGFNTPVPTDPKVGSWGKIIDANFFPGLNTQGLSIARIDFESNGINPPHVHPRASELLLVQEGTLYVGFVTSNLEGGTRGNKLYTKVLTDGDLFIFPQGLVHFQLNIGSQPASAISVFGSQNPGIHTVTDAIFGSTPPIRKDYLTTAFRLDVKTIEYLQSQFKTNTSSMDS